MIADDFDFDTCDENCCNYLLECAEWTSECLATDWDGEVNCIFMPHIDIPNEPNVNLLRTAWW